MIFIANQRTEDQEIDGESGQAGDDDANNKKQFDKLNEQLSGLIKGIDELNAKTDKMQQSAKKKKKEAKVMSP